MDLKSQEPRRMASGFPPRNRRREALEVGGERGQEQWVINVGQGMVCTVVGNYGPEAVLEPSCRIICVSVVALPLRTASE